MDFELSEEQRAFQDMARKFSDLELKPFAAEWDREHSFPVDVIHKAGKQGLCGLYTPETYAGLGLQRVDACLVFEQLAQGCTSTTAYLTVQNMCSWLLATYASDALRAKWCEALAQGEALASYCLTEPEAGSDAASLKTLAQKKGTGYRINGCKAFISGAGASDLLIVMARTSEQGAKGISAFAIDAKTPGISYGREESKMGWCSQPTRMVHFQDVVVAEEQRIGGEGEGFSIAMKALDGGRVNIASCSLGTAQAAFDRTLDYVKQRQQFGKTLQQFQSVQFRLADMVTSLAASRQLIRLAAAKLDIHSDEATQYCAMAKRFATDACFQVCDDALQLFGGYGYIKEYPLERHLRDSRVHRILEGSNEIMRVIIAKKLLQPD